MNNKIYFKFFLNRTQAGQVKTANDYAIQKYYEGKKGCVFCQIGQSEMQSDGTMLVKGCFIPNPEAKKIQKIISKVFESYKSKDDI